MSAESSLIYRWITVNEEVSIESFTPRIWFCDENVNLLWIKLKVRFYQYFQVEKNFRAIM